MKFNICTYSPLLLAISDLYCFIFVFMCLVSPHSFRMVPFLTELRAVMDWVWTDTTLSLSSWICVEDIYANIFILKCWRESEKVEQILYKYIHTVIQFNQVMINVYVYVPNKYNYE